MEIKLPTPSLKGTVSVEEAIAQRRSVRRYLRESIALPHLSQVLWAGQGITTRGRLRAAPSAGATYPLELFIFVGSDGVEGLGEGVYHYNVENHSLILVREGDLRGQLSMAALDERSVEDAPVDILICAIYERTTRRYGRRGERYVHMEAGHVGENISLEAVALGLGTVMIGAFHDDVVRETAGLEAELRPLYIIPLGKPR